VRAEVVERTATAWWLLRATGASPFGVDARSGPAEDPDPSGDTMNADALISAMPKELFTTGVRYTGAFGATFAAEDRQPERSWPS
jgi:hypothetical protein